MPWIDHPSQDAPASLRCWLKYHIGRWMRERGSQWEDAALYPDRAICQCGQRMDRNGYCDHIPF
jgi:hypothetical protein